MIDGEIRGENQVMASKSSNSLSLKEQLNLKTQRIIELEKEKEELIKRLKIYEDNDFIRSLLVASKRIQELQSRQEELEQHLEEYKSKMDELKQFGLIK